ncbi:hypothetical protein Glove_300g19 [Diversispora epigaea]|uniref:Uncharacterized protein n=1 Tax=Diversispora epigaea TaxID=1348612 RepID=A0A397I2X0_9GLOM|nr:hypothetical protein Glove_300g19 [Diversispora epigaea]
MPRESLKELLKESLHDRLEELVHELDFCIKLSKVEKKSSSAIGAAIQMQNNPLAQNHALRMNLIPDLLKSLEENEFIFFGSWCELFQFTLLEHIVDDGDDDDSIKNHKKKYLEKYQ